MPSRPARSCGRGAAGTAARRPIPTASPTSSATTCRCADSAPRRRWRAWSRFCARARRALSPAPVSLSMAPRGGRISRPAALLLAAMLLAGCTQSSPKPVPTPTQRSLTGEIGAASYVIEVPAEWNGTLFLFSHGYVAPGTNTGAQDAPMDFAREWLRQHHYALAGSSYGSTGWALEDAFRDQIALLDFFASHVGKPKRVIAWGVSLGGIITAGLVQLHPDRFAAAMPLCGVLAGGIAPWNAELDSRYAFKTR